MLVCLGFKMQAFKIQKLIQSLPTSLSSKLIALASTIPIEDINFDNIEFMNFRDALAIQNKEDKYHHSGIFNTNLDKLNSELSASLVRKQEKLSLPSYGRSWDTFIITEFADGFEIKKDYDIYAIIHDKNMYYDDDKFLGKFRRYNHELINNYIENFIRVKYASKYKHLVFNIKKKNLSRFKNLIQNIIIKDDRFTIRSESNPRPDHGDTIVVMNDEGYIVGKASDEWGATLIRVVDEYRGLGLGPILKSYWSELNPSYVSGGFTSEGFRNFKKHWVDRVSNALSSGIYSEAIKRNILSKEIVQSIIYNYESFGGKVQNKMISSVDIESKKNTNNSNKDDLIYYQPSGNMFIIYDKLFIKDNDPKYIYAYGFIQSSEHVGNFIYKIEYSNNYSEKAERIMLQVAKNIGIEYLYNDEGYSDYISLSNIPEVTNTKIEKNNKSLYYIKINKDTYPSLSSDGSLEKKIRDMAGKYESYEIETNLVEMAESKTDW